MGSKRLPQLSDLPFIAGQHMLLPPTSARPISQHCPAERPAPHSARRARPMPARPQPVMGEAEGSQRQAHEAAAVQAVHLPIRDTTGLPTSPTSPSPKYTRQRVRLEEPAPTQTAYLFMDNYHCTCFDAYLQTGIYGMHHNSSEGRNPQNF